jgi:hypothetical protein
MAAKRHHYVPRGYLQAWCDGTGKLYVCRKDDPDRLIRQAPNATAFHKHYYAQPPPDGGRDTALKEFFSTLESEWPPLVERIRRREDIDDAKETLYKFVSLQRVRVPASRDATERRAADILMAQLRALDAAGRLPPKPEEHPDILDHADFAIDPHHSIHAMPDQLRDMGHLIDTLGFTFLHNTTATPFLTSDNPVVYFDPSVPEDELKPYALTPGAPTILLFPIAPTIMLLGDSRLREPFLDGGFRHADLSDAGIIDEMNKMCCRFAYTAVFASVPGFESVVKQYADKSPIVKSVVIAGRNGPIIYFASKLLRKETAQAEVGRVMPAKIFSGTLRGHNV